jgi:hypothetical protein
MHLISWTLQSGSEQLGQHWFITANIAVYMQGLNTVYSGAGVHRTVAMLEMAGDQGRRQPPQGSPGAPPPPPPPQVLASGERRKRSEVDSHRRFALALRILCLWRL